METIYLHHFIQLFGSTALQGVDNVERKEYINSLKQCAECRSISTFRALWMLHLGLIEAAALKSSLHSRCESIYVMLAELVLGRSNPERHR